MRSMAGAGFEPGKSGARSHSFALATALTLVISVPVATARPSLGEADLASMLYILREHPHGEGDAPPPVTVLDIGANKGVVGLKFLETFCTDSLASTIWPTLKAFGPEVLGWGNPRRQRDVLRLQEKRRFLTNETAQARFCPEVHFFEVAPGNAALLERVRALHHYPAASFVVHRVGVGDKPGKLALYAGGAFQVGMEQATLASLPAQTRDGTTAEVAQVPVISIDAWLEGRLPRELMGQSPERPPRWPLSQRRFTFIKIDTEGYDLKVLRGMKGLLCARRARVVQFEWLPKLWRLVPDYSSTPLADAIALGASCGYDAYAQDHSQPNRGWVSLSANRAAWAALLKVKGHSNIVLIERSDPLKKLVDHLLAAL